MANTLVSRVPPVIDLELYAGDGVAIRFTIKNSDGTPFPLDGTITSQIRAKRTDVDATVWFDQDASQLMEGIFVLTLTGTKTQALIPTGKKSFSGVWDVQFEPWTAQPVTLIQGSVKCDLDVTRV